MGKLGPGPKRSVNKDLGPKYDDLVPHPTQGTLFKVEKQTEIDGVEMGVLENGIPYLTESGLARMCGIDRRGLNRLTANWKEERTKARGKEIDELLKLGGYEEEDLFVKSVHDGKPINAYTEPVCLALLEYYAFVSETPREQAEKAFRRLARTSFRLFIYNSVGYNPQQKAIDSWRHFHDRVDMTMGAVPQGYFSVFQETASMIVPMIRAGIIISDKTIPDISVGKEWSIFWKQNDLEKHGRRIQYEHNYPLYYPQAKSNPQLAYAYPDRILGVFRAWLHREYIIKKLPRYLLRQAGRGALPEAVATQIVRSLSP